MLFTAVAVQRNAACKLCGVAIKKLNHRTPGEKNARHSGTEPAPGVFLKWKESVPDSKKALHKLAQDAVLNQHSPGRQAQDAAVENSQPMLRKRLQEPELFGGEGYAVPRAQRAQ